jgi:type I restriction enzyme M protein
MARKKATEKKEEQTKSTRQQIGTLIKSARDIMRKDKGLSTDLDRLPLLTWVMFLKFLDDMEQIRGIQGCQARRQISASNRSALSVARLGRR